MSNSMKAC